MKSALYAGGVRHERRGKQQHKLRYRLSMFALDLDEIDALDNKLKLFAHNRAAIFSFNDRDHADCTQGPLKPQIEQRLREAGLNPDGGAITLLTMPRLLNYAFNPLSVYFCRRRDGSMLALLYEVRNTFGERHSYLLPVSRDGALIQQRCAKEFFVSPFLPMDLGYEFFVHPPGDSVGISMKVRQGDEIVLTAQFVGQRETLTDSALARAFVRDPLMTFKAIAGIHWEAIKMSLKGIKFLGRNSSPVNGGGDRFSDRRGEQHHPPSVSLRSTAPP